MAPLVHGIRCLATIISPYPGTAGTTAVVTAGQGARFPAPAVPRLGRIYDITNGLTEVVTYTRAADSFTLVRNYDGLGALNVSGAGYILEDVGDLGPYTNIPYDAGFFLPQGGGTWLPTSGNVLRHAALRVGHQLHWELVCTGTLAGTVSSIRIVIPTYNGLTAAGAKARGGGWHVLVFEGSTIVLAYVVWAAGGTYVEVFKSAGANFTAGSVSVNLREIIEVG